ncbi:MAG: hypothetical protein H6550_16290 [Chitinophagales bacterium]|nr:hypothetical protein [Chitinophagales bacterium]
MNRIDNLHVLHITHKFDGVLTLTVHSPRFRQYQRIEIKNADPYTDIAELVRPNLKMWGYNIIGKAEAKTGMFIITDTFISPKQAYKDYLNRLNPVTPVKGKSYRIEFRTLNSMETGVYKIAGIDKDGYVLLDGYGFKLHKSVISCYPVTE